MNKLGKTLLVDRVMEAYVGWREACLHVSDAYALWSRATGITATVAFARYMAALDHEQDAAEAYARLVRRASQVLASEHDPAESRRDAGSAEERVEGRSHLGPPVVADSGGLAAPEDGHYFG